MFALHGARLKLILARSCSQFHPTRICSCRLHHFDLMMLNWFFIPRDLWNEPRIFWFLETPQSDAKCSLWIFMMCSCIISFESITPVTLFHVARMPISTTGPLATWRWDKRKKIRSTWTESRLEQSESWILKFVICHFWYRILKPESHLMLSKCTLWPCVLIWFLCCCCCCGGCKVSSTAGERVDKHHWQQGLGKGSGQVHEARFEPSINPDSILFFGFWQVEPREIKGLVQSKPGSFGFQIYMAVWGRMRAPAGYPNLQAREQCWCCWWVCR